MFNARWSGKRNKLFGFHCTATRPIATRPAGVRPARPGKAMAAALAWLTAAAVLVAALTGPDPLPGEAVRLLATAFHWTLWRDLFAQATFRDGFVWESLQNPAYRFTARQRGFALYEGEVTRGRDVVLELTIDLTKPLPLEIVAYDGRDRYEAVLMSSPVARPRR